VTSNFPRGFTVPVPPLSTQAPGVASTSQALTSLLLGPEGSFRASGFTRRRAARPDQRAVADSPLHRASPGGPFGPTPSWPDPATRRGSDPSGAPTRAGLRPERGSDPSGAPTRAGLRPERGSDPSGAPTRTPTGAPHERDHFRSFSRQPLCPWRGRRSWVYFPVRREITL